MTLNNVHLSNQSSTGAYYPSSQMGAQGPVGATGMTGEYVPFSAEADGVTLYLRFDEYANWRDRIGQEFDRFNEIGRVLERIGISNGDVTLDLPDPRGQWMSLRFLTPEIATAFRCATVLPFQTHV